MPEAAYGSLPFDEALAFFRSKGIELSPGSWRDIWQAAHARAFTVAKVSAMDVLRDIRAALDDAVKEGTTLREFKKGLQETLERKGWLAPKGERAIVQMPDGTIRKRLTGWRLDTIFQTNLGSAYQTGRYKQMEEVKEARPFWQYMTVGDPSVRDEHAEHHGKVYQADHPFWDTWYPPNGFNCRCYVKSLSGRQMEQRGLKEETRGTDTLPDEGWRYNPGKAGLKAWKPDMKGYSPEERGLLKEAGV